MANTFAPVGFSQYKGTGSAPTFEQIAFPVKSTNTTPIFFGDPLVFATNATSGLSTGYVTQAPMGPQSLAISGFALANGLVTATFTSTTAPPVGSFLVLNGMTTATTLNGAWQIVSSTTTTAVFPYPGGALSTQSTTGYVFTPVVGIFVGCTYLSTAFKRTTWSNYAPGQDYNSDVTAYVVNDPNAQFIIQTGNSNTTSTALGVSSIGSNIGINYLLNGGSQSNGNTNNGLSTVFADQYTLQGNYPTGAYGQQFMPFKINGLANYGIGVGNGIPSTINGNDINSAYNNVIVSFNNAMLKNNVPNA